MICSISQNRVAWTVKIHHFRVTMTTLPFPYAEFVFSFLGWVLKGVVSSHLQN